MAENLYIRVQHHAFEWLLLDDASGIVRFRGAGDMEQFAEMTRGLSWNGATRLVLPADEILLTSAKIPSKRQRQILQAVPFMVEDMLAVDVESCHFAVGDRGSNAEVSVAVIDRERFSALLDEFEEVGVPITSVTIDVLHVQKDGGVHALVDTTRAMLRTGPSAGLGVDLESLPVAVNLLPPGTNLTVHLHPADRQVIEMQLAQIEADFDGLVEVVDLEYEPFEFLCRSFDRNALDLLQGEFRREEEKRNTSGGWRSVAILAACAVGLHVMLMIGQGIYLDVKAKQYEREASALYAEIFPGDTNVRDMRRRWQAHLGTTGGAGAGSFFELFGETAKYIPGSRLTLENVNYNESRGDLILQLVAPGSDQFVSFAKTLNKSGLQAEVGTISQDEGGQARGSIKIKAFGS
jgi:general secretion pathway protein L